MMIRKVKPREHFHETTMELQPPTVITQGPIKVFIDALSSSVYWSLPHVSPYNSHV